MNYALAIDDNLPNLKVIAQLLSKQNFHCIEISDPEKLNDLQNLPHIEAVTVIFVDLEMPSMNGYAVRDLLRTHFPHVQIIACTIHTNQMNIAKQKGFDGFIGKPLDIERFPKQLVRILNGEAVWEAL
jgi:two-component system, cell cycle response regulator DivK